MQRINHRYHLSWRIGGNLGRHRTRERATGSLGIKDDLVMLEQAGWTSPRFVTAIRSGDGLLRIFPISAANWSRRWWKQRTVNNSPYAKRPKVALIRVCFCANLRDGT